MANTPRSRAGFTWITGGSDWQSPPPTSSPLMSSGHGSTPSRLPGALDSAVHGPVEDCIS